jgi:hypothetical protein
MGGNIPLPALLTRPPDDPTVGLQRILAIKQLLGQEKTQQLQQTGLEQENQQRGLALQDQQTLRAIAPNHVTKDANGNVTGYDTEGFLNEAAGKQVNPNTLNEMRLRYADTVSKMASADEQVRTNEQAKNKAMFETLESVRGIQDPQQRQSALQQALPSLQRQGVDTSQLQGNVPLDDASLDHYEARLGMHAQSIADANKLSETVKNNADAQLKNMEAREKGSPLIKMENDPTMFAGDKLPASMAYLQGKVNDPDPVTASRAARLLSTAQVAQKTQLAMDASKKATDQAIQDGDPNAAAKLLVDGTVAPSQIISSRKPEFAQKAFTAAAQMQQGWDARKAEADFKVASSPAQVAFFGSAKSLTDKGGTLDQLKAAGDDIPGGKIPIFNSIADAIKASTGSGPIAKYASIALGVADDYSKVMGGGQGSDTSRTQALQLISAKQSPDQRAASIEGIRGAVGSQTNSRIGNNAVMQKMYGGSGTNTGNGGSQLPQGAGKVIDKATAQQFYESAGRDPNKARQLAIQNGWKVQ